MMNKSSALWGRWLGRGLQWLALGFFVAYIASPQVQEAVGRWLTGRETELIYGRGTLAGLFGEHLLMVILSGSAATLVGMVLAVVVTRPWGRDFRPLGRALVGMGQTFPPMAVLALLVPAVGFGLEPVVLSLFIFSLLPVFHGTLSGLDQVSPATVEVARALGLGPLRRLVEVELPLASASIFTGVKTAMMVNVGTATLGAVVAAGGLGAPIMQGLVRDNSALIIQGSLSATGLALAMYQLLSWMEKTFFKRGGAHGP